MLVLASTSSSSVSKKERATKLAGSDFQTTTLRLFPRKIRIARRRGKDNDGRPKPNARGRARRARVSRPRAQPMGTDGCRGTTTRAHPLSILHVPALVSLCFEERFGFWIFVPKRDVWRDECLSSKNAKKRKTEKGERREAPERYFTTTDESRVFFSLYNVLY